jgi:hypothetical protein
MRHETEEFLGSHGWKEKVEEKEDQRQNKKKELSDEMIMKKLDVGESINKYIWCVDLLLTLTILALFPKNIGLRSTKII